MIVQMFRIMFDLPRSLICIKDLLLHINPLKDIKECTYEKYMALHVVLDKNYQLRQGPVGQMKQ